MQWCSGTKQFAKPLTTDSANTAALLIDALQSGKNSWSHKRVFSRDKLQTWAYLNDTFVLQFFPTWLQQRGAWRNIYDLNVCCLMFCLKLKVPHVWIMVDWYGFTTCVAPPTPGAKRGRAFLAFQVGVQGFTPEVEKYTKSYRIYTVPVISPDM